MGDRKLAIGIVEKWAKFISDHFHTLKCQISRREVFIHIFKVWSFWDQIQTFTILHDHLCIAFFFFWDWCLKGSYLVYSTLFKNKNNLMKWTILSLFFIFFISHLFLFWLFSSYHFMILFLWYFLLNVDWVFPPRHFDMMRGDERKRGWDELSKRYDERVLS